VAVSPEKINQLINLGREQMSVYLLQLLQSLLPANGSNAIAVEVHGANSFMQALKVSATSIAG
jgi:hypothetical protein